MRGERGERGHIGYAAGGEREGAPDEARQLLEDTPVVERLDYIAEMVRQLRLLSTSMNCRTLSSLLELAYHEAIERRRSR